MDVNRNYNFLKKNILKNFILIVFDETYVFNKLNGLWINLHFPNG